jgi:hypothetical protein
MVKLLKEQEESSVRLLDLQISEDEVTVIVAALKHLLENYRAPALERICGALRDEIEGIVEDLDEVLGHGGTETEDSYLAAHAD